MKKKKKKKKKGFQGKRFQRLLWLFYGYYKWALKSDWLFRFSAAFLLAGKRMRFRAIKISSDSFVNHTDKIARIANDFKMDVIKDNIIV